MKTLIEWEEQAAWRNYRAARYLYHVSRPDAMPFILAEGLQSRRLGDNDPQRSIRFFVKDTTAHIRLMDAAVAANLGLRTYALWRIRKSMIPPATIRWDNVGQPGNIGSFYCLVDHVAPAYIKLVGMYKLR
jgi:hypothetical protein